MRNEKQARRSRRRSRARTQTAIVVAFSLLCSVYVAARMVQSSRIRDALVDDLNDADAGAPASGPARPSRACLD